MYDSWDTIKRPNQFMGVEGEKLKAWEAHSIK
jgi:hypothetical protein